MRRHFHIAEHIGCFLSRDCVDLFDEGQIVTEHDINRQLEVFRTGRLSVQEKWRDWAGQKVTKKVTKLR